MNISELENLLETKKVYKIDSKDKIVNVICDICKSIFRSGENAGFTNCPNCWNAIVREKKKESGPKWKCLDCKHKGRDFRTISWETDWGTEFDLECPSCNSTHVLEA